MGRLEVVLEPQRAQRLRRGNRYFSRIRNRLRICALLVGVLVWQTVRVGAQPTATTPPSYKLERWDEDYSYLRDPAKRTDFFDPVKYIPLGNDPDWYLTLGGLVRERYEYFNHDSFGAGPQSKYGYYLTRLDLYTDLHLSRFIRVFVEGRSALESGRVGGPRGRDMDTLDPQQAFVDLMLPLGDNLKFTLRTGRQELLFGAERLIGPADFSNVRKTFDGVRGTINSPNNQLDLFLTRPVLVQKYTFDNADNTTVFGGIYDTLQLPDLILHGKTQLEGYLLYLKRKGAMWPSVTGPGYENRYTLGARISGQPDPFDYDVEADWQWGSFRGEDIRAYSLASVVGYNVSGAPLAPHPFLGFDIASGDRRPNDGKLETFNQLFPSGHSYFGYINVIGRQNIIDLHPGFDLTFLKNQPYVQNLGLRTEYHQFWRQSTTDAMYDTTGAIVRRGTGTKARDLGSEIDLLLRWQIDRHLGTYFGYSHFFHGPFIQSTGTHKDIDFAYAAVTFTF